jgi:rubredoxin
MLFTCRTCGYSFDTVLGDPENGIMPGEGFGDPHEEWSCPVCASAHDPENHLIRHAMHLMGRGGSTQ